LPAAFPTSLHSFADFPLWHAETVCDTGWDVVTNTRVAPTLWSSPRSSGTIELVAEWETKTYNEVAMRILAGCLLVALGSVVMTQGSLELRGRYGEPDLERFIARPGIGLTVQYGSDHLACQVLIESPQPLIYTKEDVSLMSPETVTEILEEVTPVDTRGKQIGSATSMMGCNESEIAEYENVSITRSTHNCLPLMPEREMRATIAFNRDSCPKRRSLFNATP
jgi:hypothetical protein